MAASCWLATGYLLQLLTFRPCCPVIWPITYNTTRVPFYEHLLGQHQLALTGFLVYFLPLLVQSL